jgi:MFS family permease
VGAPDLRHNFVALGLDYGFFLVGMSFASSATILPAFAAHLEASNVAIGAIPAVQTLGWLLPSLFTAHHVEQLDRKMPFVLRYTIWERVPMAALAAVAFWLAGPAPHLALAAFFALLLVMAGTGGALMPGWLDVVGRAIPTTLRGRFFASANVAANLAGLAGSAVTAWLLAAFPAPDSYGYCFLTAAAFLGISYVFLARVREPAGATPAEPRALGTYLARMPALLRRDRDLAWFLVARGLGTLGTMATGFYTVYALRTWQAPEWLVGALTSAFLVGQVLGNASLGWLADRVGHRLVLVLGLGALAAGNAAALAAGSAGAIAAVLGLAGVHQAALHISSRTILLELAPEAERPTYIGLTNTGLAPLTFAGPLGAGLVADRLGFAPVFLGAALFAMAGLLVLATRVREPRLDRVA